jgi:hypothetical protein
LTTDLPSHLLPLTLPLALLVHHDPFPSGHEETPKKVPLYDGYQPYQRHTQLDLRLVLRLQLPHKLLMLLF